jgi:glycosyltransferase involved in cell wall biosynthesis
MNILILNWRDPKNPKSGGAEIVTINHAKAWVKAGHRVTWLTSSFRSSKKKEKIEGVNIIRRGNSISVYLFAPFYYLFSGNKFDVVIDEIHGLPFFTPIYVRKPKIIFIHEVADEIWDYMYPFPISKIGKMVENLYFKLYKNIKCWTDADSTADDLEKYGIKRENCTIINCPISNKTLIKFSEKEDIPTFIFVSRIVRMKGIENVIKAFLCIEEKLKNVKLWIVGDGDDKYMKELKGKIKKCSAISRIKFFGHVSEEKKLELMGKAHLLLHASIKEGWGLVVIEAASQATPSIVYNVSGLRDSVKDCKTGIVLEENTPEEMARKTVALLEDKEKYSTFQKNGLQWARSLTWDKATRKSLALLEDIVGKN